MMGALTAMVDSSLLPSSPAPDASTGPRWWSATRLFTKPRPPGLGRLIALGVSVNVVAVVTGLMNVHFGWNGIHVPLGPVALDLTVYPPLLISVLAVVWVGPTWGLLPAYLANFASATYEGMPPGTAALFACAGALETAILWGSMVVLGVSPDLRRGRDLAAFVTVGFIAATISSLAVLIWNTSLGLDFIAGQRVWRGWVVGDFLLLTFVVAPILRWAGPAARTWVDRQFAEPPRQEASFSHAAAFAWSVLVVMGGLVLVGTQMLRRSLDIPPDARTASGELLGPRLAEIELFFALLVFGLLVTTGAFSTALARLSERERSDARRDSLTGCFNRRAYYELFKREADRCRRLGQPLSLVFLDVDHFKVINDRYGHDAGDVVLLQLAGRLQAVTRETDLVFRWGGEEFVVLLSHTPAAEARTLAERIQAAVGGEPFTGRSSDPPLALTVSVGVAGAAGHDDDPGGLVARADAACYRAKGLGRNRIEAD
jgi:diguanylate cyclase